MFEDFLSFLPSLRIVPKTFSHRNSLIAKKVKERERKKEKYVFLSFFADLFKASGHCPRVFLWWSPSAKVSLFREGYEDECWRQKDRHKIYDRLLLLLFQHFPFLKKEKENLLFFLLFPSRIRVFLFLLLVQNRRLKYRVSHYGSRLCIAFVAAGLMGNAVRPTQKEKEERTRKRKEEREERKRKERGKRDRKERTRKKVFVVAAAIFTEVDRSKQKYIETSSELILYY